jgi:hypothetical protein
MKGFHTAGAAVLFRSAPRADAVASALAALPECGPLPAPAAFDWMGGAPGFAASFPRGGRLVAQVYDRPWPDGMGDPKTDPDLFAAWTMGFFGPFAYPGGLARAARQSWGWKGARDAVAAHRSFVRLGVTYVAGAAPDQPVLPGGYDAPDELRRLTDVGLALAGLDGALAWFDPSGEVLMSAEMLRVSLGRELPLDAWSNVRMNRLGDLAPWMLMDTVGLLQLDRDDLEACFDDRVEPNAVAAFLRNVSLYLLKSKAVIADGNTLDGPGGRWRAWAAQSLTDPPRPALRMFPDGATPPVELWKGIMAPRPDPPKTGWRRWFG